MITIERIGYSNENLRKNINYLTKKYNITKKTLDEDLEIGLGSMSRYCKEEYSIEPRVAILNSLARSFGITIDDLINTDIENKEKKELEDSQRKDVLFYNKLIKETKENILNWHRLNDDAWRGYEESLIYNFLKSNNRLNDEFSFVRAFSTTIIENTQVILLKFFEIPMMDEENLEIYELCLVKPDGKVLQSCISHELPSCELYKDDFLLSILEPQVCEPKDIYFNILDELHTEVSRYVSLGSDDLEKELIYCSYLNN